MIRFLQFPFFFDASQMQSEVKGIAKQWIAHFNKHDYEGGWSGIPLRSPGGVLENLVPDEFNNVEFSATSLLQQSPYLAKTLSEFKCEIMSARLLKLDRGALIKPHRDLGLNFEEGEARIHIPVITHPDLEFYVDGERLHLREGECWYINANLIHSVSNPSPVDRIHLVFDCKVNDWLQELFNSDKLLCKSEKDTSAETDELKKNMIRELRLSENPEMHRLADEMENQ